MAVDETENRGMITNMDLKVYMGSLKNNPRITEEMLRLVEEDLRFGLTPKETEEYTGKKLDYAQMKAYSRCLRSGCGREAVEVITKEGLSGEQMALALEFYEKGMPLAMVAEITGKTDQTAFAMKKLFSNVMEKLEKAGKSADAEAAYAGEVLEQIRRVVEKIDFQEKRYDALNERLKELHTAGQDAEERNRLLSQLAEKDRLLEKQQDEINSARAESAKLRSRLDEMGMEKLCLEKRIREMEQQLEKNSRQPEACGCSKMPEGFPERAWQDTDNGKARKFSAEQTNSSIECRNDGAAGNERPAAARAADRKHKGILHSLFSGSRMNKKADIIKMVAEKGLEPDQLVQIRKGIEKGLTRQQLMVLVSHPAPAAQMEEIINIAVYENRQEGGV